MDQLNLLGHKFIHRKLITHYVTKERLAEKSVNLSFLY